MNLGLICSDDVNANSLLTQSNAGLSYADNQGIEVPPEHYYNAAVWSAWRTSLLSRVYEQTRASGEHAAAAIVKRCYSRFCRVSDAMPVGPPDESNYGRVIDGKPCVAYWQCEKHDQAAAISIGIMLLCVRASTARHRRRAALPVMRAAHAMGNVNPKYGSEPSVQFYTPHLRPVRALPHQGHQRRRA
jgi:hypothetical protein